MKKIKIQTQIKVIISIALSLAAIILFILQFIESKNYKTTEKEIELYKYTITTDIKYDVKLLENNIFDKNILPQDGVYITSLVDDINLNIINSYSGNEKVEIKGKYNITATMKGSITEQNITKLVWSKNFILREDSNFYIKSNRADNVESITIDYDWFNNLAKEINESIKLGANSVLDVVLNIEYNVETKYGIIKETVIPTISIPLNSSHFTPISSNIDDITNSIKQTDKLTIDPNFTVINIYRIFIAITIIIIILLFVFTVKPTEFDLYIKKINNIFKNYSKYLVGVKSTYDLKFKNIYYVKNFTDLIKISEEVEKPIFYNDNEKISEINKFYVINESIKYIYYIKPLDAIIPSEKLEDIKTT